MSERTVAKELKGCLDVLIVLLIPIGLLLVLVGQVEVPHLGSLQEFSWIGGAPAALAIVYVAASLWRTK